MEGRWKMSHLDRSGRPISAVVDVASGTVDRLEQWPTIAVVDAK